MIEKKWGAWGAMIAAACVLAGCGGDSDSEPATSSYTQTTGQAPSRHIAGGDINIATGTDAAAIAASAAEPQANAGAVAMPAPAPAPVSVPVPVADAVALTAPVADAKNTTNGEQHPSATAVFDGKEIAGFPYVGDNSYGSTGVKLMISAIGPQKLTDHLNQFKQAAQDANEILAAEKFIDLIHTAYHPDSTLKNKLQEFLDTLPALPPFKATDESGTPKFRRNQGRQQVEPFLELLAQSFHLNSMPGRSLDLKETCVYAGYESYAPTLENSFPFTHTVELAGITPHRNGLQALVDLLHRDEPVLAKYGPTISDFVPVTVTKEAHVADLENFDRLTLSLNGFAEIFVDLSAPVTLPVFDKKTEQKMLLTLAPTQVVLHQKGNYQALIKTGASTWRWHIDDVVSTFRGGDFGASISMISFTVIGRKPAG